MLNFFAPDTGPKCARLFKGCKAKDWATYIADKLAKYDSIHVVSVNHTTAT